MQAAVNIPPVMTFSECKAILKVGKDTLLELLHSGRIDGFMIGSGGGLQEKHWWIISNA